VNAAMRLSSAPLVAWINNDVRLEPRWLETMVEAMRDERVGAVQSIIAGPDGRIDGAGITIADGTFRQRGHSLPIGTLLADPIWGVSATAALYRRAALEAVTRGDEVLDERFFAYYEDVELAARLVAAGWRARVVEEPLAFHHGSMSELRIDALRLRTRNRYLVRRLHPEAGSFSALLQEDAREILRSAARGRIARVARIKLAVFEGLFKRL
jgi:GT2 family glycosyltransferase